MTVEAKTRARPKRLWLLGVVLAIVVAGAWSSRHLRAEDATAPDASSVLG